MWSDELQEQTREYFKSLPIAAMKQYEGKYGICTLIDDKYIIKDRETKEVYEYSTMDELINAKWAID